MTTYGAQMDRKCTGSAPEVSVCMSVHPKPPKPYLLYEPYARDLQAQGACALRFLSIEMASTRWGQIFVYFLRPLDRLSELTK